MKFIPLTRGKRALIDDGDFEWLSQWKWSLSGDGRYAVRTRRVSEQPGPLAIYMHRELAAHYELPEVDHRNGITLDNRRSNLRPCTHRQNQANRPGRFTSSRYRGLTRRQQASGRIVWIAQLTHRYLGTFTDEITAARTYDEAAFTLYGEFARLNFPENFS